MKFTKSYSETWFLDEARTIPVIKETKGDCLSYRAKVPSLGTIYYNDLSGDESESSVYQRILEEVQRVAARRCVELEHCIRDYEDQIEDIRNSIKLNKEDIEEIKSEVEGLINGG